MEKQYEGYQVGIDPAHPGGDQSVDLSITDEMRRKIFGYAKAAWEAVGAPEPFNDWRHEQQQACGISSLKFATKPDFFKLVQHYMGIVREAEERKAGGTPAVRTTNKAGGSPAGRTYKDGTPITANSNSSRVLMLEGCANEPQLRKINALLVDQSLSWEYADAMALRMFKVKQVQWCDGRQLRAVIAALTKRQQKHGGRRETAKPKELKQELLFADPKQGAPL